FAFLGHTQVPQAILDVTVDDIPVKTWIIVAEVVRVFKPQFGIGAVFLKLVKQGGKFAQMVWIGKLSNEVGSTDEPWIICRPLMISIFWHRKAGVLNIGGNDFCINDRISIKAFADEQLPPIHMIRRHRGIGSTWRQRNRG